MPKPSKYIEKKANNLLDLYVELEGIKKSKAFKDGDTAMVRRPRCASACAPGGAEEVVLDPSVECTMRRPTLCRSPSTP